MRHARPEDLAPLAELLGALRALPGLRERKPGTFYRGAAAFLHFHADPAGLFADVKLGGEFARFRVTTRREQAALLRAARQALAAGKTTDVGRRAARPDRAPTRR